jgi:hypothetical protein
MLRKDRELLTNFNNKKGGKELMLQNFILENKKAPVDLDKGIVYSL